MINEVPFAILMAADYMEEHEWPNIAGIMRVPRMFFTGSRVYGTPHSESDLDMVLFVSQEEDDLIYKVAALENARTNTTSKCSVRFGRLNVITNREEVLHQAWYEGTLHLMRRKPVTRGEAITHFENLFRERCPQYCRIPQGVLEEAQQNPQQFDSWIS